MDVQEKGEERGDGGGNSISQSGKFYQNLSLKSEIQQKSKFLKSDPNMRTYLTKKILQ